MGPYVLPDFTMLETASRKALSANVSRPMGHYSPRPARVDREFLDEPCGQTKAQTMRAKH
jgi:hypothetical protein